jgi:hypothetical protein
VAVAEKDFAFPAALRALRQFQVGAQDELLQAYAARGATVPAAALLRRQCCLMALEMLLVGPKRMLPALDDVDPGPFEADGRRLLGDGWAADYAARGYAVVDGCLGADELDALRADVAAVHAAGLLDAQAANVQVAAGTRGDAMRSRMSAPDSFPTSKPSTTWRVTGRAHWWGCVPSKVAFDVVAKRVWPA